MGIVYPTSGARRGKLPMATKAAQGRSVALNAELLVNMYAEQAQPGSKNQVSVIGCPGAASFSSISTKLIRGVHWVPNNGTLWVVCGLTLYKVTSGGASTSIGSIGGYGRVSMADNGTQLCIVTEAIGYIVTLASDTLAPITDSDFPNADTVAYLGGYFFFNNNQSGSEGQLFWSSLYGGSAYDALDFATAENSPDNLVAVWRDHDRLLLFGDDTTESWFLTGDDTIVAPYKGSVINRGLGARWSIANVDNSVIFLDDNGIVRRIGGQGGYSAERVSTHALEYDIAQGSWRHDDANAYDGAVASAYIEEGHEFYVLTIPNRATWVFDAATQVWHKRKSKSLETSRLSFHIAAFNKILCGDTERGTLYEQKLDYYDEDGEKIVAEVQFPAIQSNGDRFRVHELELLIEVGTGAPVDTVSVTGGFQLGDWTQQNDGFDYNYREVNYGNGVFLLVTTTGEVVRSADNGVTWSEISTPFGSDPIYDVFYDPLYDKWVISGDKVRIATSDDNGLSFTSVNGGVSGNYLYGGGSNGSGTWVISGVGAVIYRSTDGASFSLINTGLSANRDFTWSTYGDGRWFTVGANTANTPSVIYSDDDGLTWSVSSAGETAADGHTLESVEYNDGVWVVVGSSGFIMRSTDNGNTWTEVTSSFGSTDIREVGYGFGLWFAVGGAGKIASSSDNGLTWTQVESTSFTSGDIIDSITYGNGVFVAESNTGKVATLDATTLTTSVSTVASEDTPPYVMLDVLSDGNVVPDTTQAWKSIGAKGDYDKRVIWRRLGQHRSFTPRFSISSPVKRVIFDATARISSDG